MSKIEQINSSLFTQRSDFVDRKPLLTAQYGYVYNDWKLPAPPKGTMWKWHSTHRIWKLTRK